VISLFLTTVTIAFFVSIAASAAVTVASVRAAG
jgi:hypothetical protein